jgi:hypothetical protein
MEKSLAAKRGKILKTYGNKKGPRTTIKLLWDADCQPRTVGVNDQRYERCDLREF